MSSKKRKEIKKVSGKQEVVESVDIIESAKKIWWIKDLKILDQLGSGSFSKVFKILDEKTKQYYVLKLSSREKINKSKSKQNSLKNELIMLEKCQHIPGVPNVYKYDEDDKYIYLLEQYLPGYNLLEYIQHSVTDEYEIFSIFYSLYEILKNIHRNGICHHDMKQDNVIIDPERLVVAIIDFGLSEGINLEHNPNFYTDLTCGTIDFTSPEKHAVYSNNVKNSYDGRKSDLYALGVTLFCMVFKRFPYSQDYIKEKLKNPKEFNKDPELTKNEIYNYGLSAAAIDFVVKMVSWNPKKRLNFEDLEKHPWFSINQIKYCSNSM